MLSDSRGARGRITFFVSPGGGLAAGWRWRRSPTTRPGLRKEAKQDARRRHGISGDGRRGLGRCRRRGDASARSCQLREPEPWRRRHRGSRPCRRCSWKLKAVCAATAPGSVSLRSRLPVAGLLGADGAIAARSSRRCTCAWATGCASARHLVCARCCAQSPPRHLLHLGPRCCWRERLRPHPNRAVGSRIATLLVQLRATHGPRSRPPRRAAGRPRPAPW